MIGVHGLLRHPMWGPDTEQFKPERWLQPDSLPDHPSINAAFGLGKRNCIGNRFLWDSFLRTLIIKKSFLVFRFHHGKNLKPVGGLE